MPLTTTTMATTMATTRRARCAGKVALAPRCCLSQRPERPRTHHAKRNKVLRRQNSSGNSGNATASVGASAHPDALRRREEARQRRSVRGDEAQDTAFQQAKRWFEEGLERVGLHLNVRAVGATERQEFHELVRQGVAEEGASSSAAATPSIVVAQFTADWCKACEEMQGKMFDVYSQHKDVTFIKVDAKDNLQLCRDLGVKRLPWLQIYDAREETNPLVNVHANKKNQKLLSRQLNQLKQML